MGVRLDQGVEVDVTRGRIQVRLELAGQEVEGEGLGWGVQARKGELEGRWLHFDSWCLPQIYD